MSTHETALVYSWLYSTLSGDSTLSGYAPGGVWRGMAPPQTATPFVIISLQSGSDVVTMNGYRMIVDVLYQVKAVGPVSNTAGIVSAASRIDDLLKLTTGTVAGGAILSCYRQS